MATMLQSYEEYQCLFGDETSTSSSSKIPNPLIAELLRRSWTGSTCSMSLRGICWRVYLGLLSAEDKGLWEDQLKVSIRSYKELKSRVMPSIDKVKADPLSSLASDTSSNDEWNSYYKNVELTTFIKGDLDRLYLSGIDDDYFQCQQHRDILLTILFIWSMEHAEVSYRQGMHEIVGSVFFVLDCERKAFQESIASGKVPASHSIFCLFNENNLETFTYALFERIMLELICLYDPLPVQGIESQPFVVHYCAKIQEHYLRILDPDLCQHLEESFVQSQLYGLRWSRLLLGREFPVDHDHLYRLWDFMFASCYDIEAGRPADFLDDDAPPNVYSVLANVRALGYNKNSNIGKRISNERVTYVCTPLLGALGDLMLAMLIKIRTKLLEADSSFVIGYLMRYPDGDQVLPVLECADMIRRGVIVQSINYNGAILNYHSDSMTPPKDYHPVQLNDLKSAMNLKSLKPTLNNMGKKMQDFGNSLSAAVGSGFTDLMNTLLDTEEEQRYSSYSQQPPTAMTPNNRTVGNTGTVAPRRDSNKPQQRIKVEYDYEDEPPPQEDKSVQVNPNADPLLGVENMNVVTRSKKTSPSNNDGSVSPKEPGALKGMGTSYGNMPDTVVLPHKSDADPLAQMMTSPQGSNAPKKTGKSLFSTNWFPSSSSAATNSASATKHKITKDTEKGSRLSAGVDLGVLSQERSDSSHASELTFSHKKLKNSDQTDAIGDRLLDLATELIRLSRKDQGGDESSDLCIATAKRLQGLADVLAGYSTIVDFDVKFGNKALPAPSWNNPSHVSIQAASGEEENDQELGLIVSNTISDGKGEEKTATPSSQSSSVAVSDSEEK